MKFHKMLNTFTTMQVSLWDLVLGQAGAWYVWKSIKLGQHSSQLLQKNAENVCVCVGYYCKKGFLFCYASGACCLKENPQKCLLL